MTLGKATYYVNKLLDHNAVKFFSAVLCYQDSGNLFSVSYTVRLLEKFKMYVPLRMLNLVRFLSLSLVFLLCPLNIDADEPARNTIESGKAVSLDYTVSLPDGTVVHSNADGYPIKYRQGDGKLLPALEAMLVGMAAGDEKSVTLPPEDTYPVNQDAFREVPLDQVPEDARRVGAVFRPEGFLGSIRVAGINEGMALLDFNHPLAGKTLRFDIKILAVE